MAAFKEDGACGRFDPQWLSESRAASEFRSSGQTAEYEEHMFNETWQSERETLSDDEDISHSRQRNGDGDEEGDCNNFSLEDIKESNNDTSHTSNAARPSNKVLDDIGWNNNKQLYGEMDATQDAASGQHSLDSPMSRAPDPQTTQ